MAKFKLEALLKKYSLKKHKVNVKNVFPYNCQSITAHPRVLSVSDCIEHTYKGGRKDNPSINERLLLKMGVRITLLELPC